MLSLIIQSGGQSIRMGRDKALIPFLGQPLIARIAQRLAPVAQEMIVITNHPDAYLFLGLTLVPDHLPGEGAIGGIYTALKVAEEPFVAVVACDMPFVSPHLIQAEVGLIDKLRVDVVIPRTSNGLEPLHAVYRKQACLPEVLKAIQKGEKRLVSWLFSVNVYEMPVEEAAVYDPSLLCFTNLNSPEDFSKAEELARQREE